MATEKAVKYFANAKSRLKLKGNDELQNALDTIERRATSRGLDPQHIISLIDVAASGTQVEAINKRLIKALIPATVVPDEAVLKCVSWMCTRKPSINMQCLLVRWILVIYEYIDKLDRIHNLYGIFFHFLHYRSMRSYVSHLLYLLTRKEDIKLFRVRMLIQYQKDLGSQPFLIGLLSIYKHFYPGLIHVVLPRTYKSFFSTYDRKWMEQVRRIREQAGLPAEIETDWNKALSERLQSFRKPNDLEPSRKRRKIDPIPVLHSLTTKSTYKKDNLQHTLGLTRIPFVQVDTLKSILDHIDSIEFPSQIGAVLKSDTLRHLMSYTKDPTAAARFQFWLGETLEEELVQRCNKDDYKARVTRFLSLLASFCDFLQEGVPAVDVVLLEYLQTWNGVDFAPQIFRLISKCRMYPFNVLCSAMLEPLKKIFVTSSVYSKCQILICLTELLRNLAANEWPRQQELSMHLSLFCGSMEEEFDPTDTLTQCINFVSRMILIGSIKEKHHVLFEYCVLDFLDLVSSLHQMYKIPYVVVTDTMLYERLMISPNPVTVSRVCEIMCRFRMNFISLKRLVKTHEIHIDLHSSQSSNMLSNCNLLIIDFSNCLWRSKAFITTNEMSIFNFDPREMDDRFKTISLNDSFLVFKHQAFLGYFLRFLRKKGYDMESFPELMKELRREFIRYLSSCGLSGISQFVSTFIRSISSRDTMTSTQILGLSQNFNHQ